MGGKEILRIDGRIVFFIFLLFVGLSMFFVLNKNQNITEENFFSNLNESSENLSNTTSTVVTKITIPIEEKKEGYLLSLKEESKVCNFINGTLYFFDNNGSSYEFNITNSVLELNEKLFGNASLIFSLDNSDCKIKGFPYNYKFVFRWDNLTIDNDIILSFNISERDPHVPNYFMELTNYVRPKDVEWFLESFKSQIPSFEYDALNFIKKRTEAEVRYRFEFGSEWLFPNETLRNGYGDCEDFSTLLLSLFKAYNKDIKCYNLLVNRHLTTFCILYFEQDYPTFAFFDMGDTRIRENWYRVSNDYEKCNRLKALVEEFYSSYGLTPIENKVLAAFDDKNMVIFSNMDEFCNFVINIA